MRRAAAAAQRRQTERDRPRHLPAELTNGSLRGRRLTVNTGQPRLAPACFPVWREALLQSIFKTTRDIRVTQAAAVHLFPDAAACRRRGDSGLNGARMRSLLVILIFFALAELTAAHAGAFFDLAL